MLAIDWLKSMAKPGYTVTPITMVRKIGIETCYDTRPLYGPDGKWLTPAERGPECGHQHTNALRCTNGSGAHRHKDHCYHRVHANVSTPGFLFVSSDGKFQAQVYGDAEAPHTGKWTSKTPSSRAPKLKADDISAEKIAALGALDGVEEAIAIKNDDKKAA